MSGMKILPEYYLFFFSASRDIKFSTHAMTATWVYVTLVLSQLYLIAAVHNITEALAALAPVPFEDLETKTMLMSETGTSFSVTNNIARKVENQYWVIGAFVSLGYFLQ